MTALRLGVLAYPVTAPASFDDFATKLDGLVAEGSAGGGELLVMPEYACLELAAASPSLGDVVGELDGVCRRRDALFGLFAELARRHRVWLLPGTMPWTEAGQIRNRAPLAAPNGSLRFQDKATMTRFEAERMGVVPGAPPCVFATPWGRLGIAICYDVEFSPLVRAQVEAGAWLILAPSCTDSAHGFNRVQLSARARALENQCFVVVSPTVGTSPVACLDENHGHAAIFGPIDHGFADDGIVARGEMDAPGWIFADLDPARIEAVRAQGAVRNHRDFPRTPIPEPSEVA